MKAITIIENDDGRIVLTYSPAEPNTPEIIRLLHSAMAMAVSIHANGEWSMSGEVFEEAGLACSVCGDEEWRGCSCGGEWVPTSDEPGLAYDPTEPVHWTGEAPTSLHGNGASSFARTSTDTTEVTCKLCLTLLARFDELAARFGLGTEPTD